MISPVPACALALIAFMAIAGTTGAATVSAGKRLSATLGGSFYAIATRGQSVPEKWITGIDAAYDDGVVPSPVTPPPADDFISDTLHLDFNAHFAIRWNRIDTELADRWFRLANQKGRKAAILRTILSVMIGGYQNGPDQPICSCTTDGGAITPPIVIGPTAAIPEPTAVLLLSSGLVTFALRRRRDGIPSIS